MTQQQYEEYRNMLNSVSLPDSLKQKALNDLDVRYKEHTQGQQSQQFNDLFNQTFSADNTNRNVNVLNQALNAQQQKAIQGFQQRQAAQTGGRLGSAARGEQNIAGQFALAQAQGLNEIFNQQMRNKVQALNAYIAKYGIDQEALNLMKQIQAQLQMTDAQNRSDIIGSIIGSGGEIIAAGI